MYHRRWKMVNPALIVLTLVGSTLPAGGIQVAPLVLGVAEEDIEVPDPVEDDGGAGEVVQSATQASLPRVIPRNDGIFTD